jgi:glyceraldehyde 3-phosphate dehydrogenase
MIRVAINGFGRIGRRFLRLALNHPDIQVVAINEIGDPLTAIHLLKYDSIFGILDTTLEADLKTLYVGRHAIRYTQESAIEAIDWASIKVDIVIEATGKFKTSAALTRHLEAGAKKVILAAVPDDTDIPMVILGVNEHRIDFGQTILSNGSCTTNNAAPMIRLIEELCGIEQAYVTTVHSYTSDQSLHDRFHKDLRRARSAPSSIIPTTTGAAKALTRVFPHLADCMGGCGIRVPVPNGSLTDITFNVSKTVSVPEINNHFLAASRQDSYKGILAYTTDPIVSVDILSNTHSCLFDASMTSVIGKMVKVIGWYDNETGYSSRLIDLVRRMR